MSLLFFVLCMVSSKFMVAHPRPLQCSLPRVHSWGHHTILHCFICSVCDPDASLRTTSSSSASMWVMSTSLIVSACDQIVERYADIISA